MTSPVRVGYDLRVTLPADLGAMEEVVAEFRRWTEGRACRKDSFAAELLLREALTNSVVHGCRSDPSRRIRCVLRFRNRCLTIAVRDPGGGFDWRSARECARPLAAPSGRGVQILRHYAAQVRFNQKGNWITMIRRFS